MRTGLAVTILLVYFGVIVEGMLRGDYSPAITAMAPALSLAAGFLFGRDMIDIFVTRGEIRRRAEKEKEQGEEA